MRYHLEASPPLLFTRRAYVFRWKLFPSSIEPLGLKRSLNLTSMACSVSKNSKNKFSSETKEQFYNFFYKTFARKYRSRGSKSENLRSEDGPFFLKPSTRTSPSELHVSALSKSWKVIIFRYLRPLNASCVLKPCYEFFQVRLNKI